MLKRELGFIKPQCILIATVQWLITTILRVERFFFINEKINPVMIGIKFFYFLALLVGWHFLFHVYDRLKTADAGYKRGLIIFCIHYLLLLILTFLLWPGTWGWDDVLMLYQESGWGGTVWQHFLTGVYHEILLQFLPFPGGIIILQNLLIAVSVAFVIVKLETVMGLPILPIKWLDILIKLVPFFLPPVLMYQFSGYRMGIYIYIELVMLVMLICSVKDAHEWSFLYVILFGMISALAAVFRSESLLYTPIVCISLFFIKKEIIPVKKKLVAIGVILCLVAGINIAQSKALGDESYKLVSVLPSCVELIRNVDKAEDIAVLKEMERAIDFDIIYAHPEASAEKLYWTYGVIKEGHSKEDFRSCIEALVRLSLKYPEIVAKERIELFKKSIGINGKPTTNYEWTYPFFDSDYNNRATQVYRESAWLFKNPISIETRKTIINALNKPRFLWNALPTIISLLVGLVYALHKKETVLILAALAVVLKLPIVFLTQPAGWIMYVLSFYFLGSVVVVYGLLFGTLHNTIKHNQV